MNKDALVARLRATFLGELEDQVCSLNDHLLALESAPRDSERLRTVFRIVHTLKGAAHAAGIPLVEHVCHDLEARLIPIRDGKGELLKADFAMLFAAADALADAARRLRANDDLVTSPLAVLAEDLARGGPVASPPQKKLRPDDTPTPAAPSAAPERPVRVAATWLDALFAATGELTVMESRMAARPADTDALRALAATWTADWRRTRAKLRRLPDAGQSLSWMDEHLRRFAHETERLTARLADDARMLAHVADRLSDQVRYIRLRPFVDACEALPRVARDVALTTGRDVALTIDGGDVRADREVLDIVRDALLHLVRNAVDHGIETPAERERAGKPKTGTVHVAAAVRGDRLVVTVADDGRGLDTAAIQARLRERGVTDMPAPSELGQVLLRGGLSTRREAGLISGRGVGLDAVRDAIERVRGSFDVAWTPGKGTTFTLTCPPSIATVRALLVDVGGRMLAFPSGDVERVTRLPARAIGRAAGRDVMMTDTETGNDAVPLAPLAQILGVLSNDLTETEHLTVVTLVAEAGRRLGVVVDRAVEEREIVLQPLPTGGQSLPLVSGAAPLGTGQVVLLLNAPAVVAAGLGARTAIVRPPVPEAERPRHRLLVADDSLTTRTLEQSVLEAAGYEVTTAMDGAHAWELLQAQPHDLVVSDVEMPRMDGFTLCETIRQSVQYAQLPVVLVTALDAPEHRARGLEAGADAYVTKASFDHQALLETIRRLLE